MIDFSYKVIWQSLPYLLEGLKYTLLVSIAGLAGGFLIGSAAGILLTNRNLVVRRLVNLYVDAIRGTPLMVQVMFVYFGLPLLTGLRLLPLIAGIGAIAINAGAYIAEIVRGAIQSIDKGQREAGASLGMTKFQTLRYVVWPQALRRMIPPLGNQLISFCSKLTKKA
jgi:glutamine transport system permease protein